MSKHAESKSQPKFKGKITHIMADGSVRDSIEGYVIPYNQQTAIVYELLAKYSKPTQKSLYEYRT